MVEEAVAAFEPATPDPPNAFVIASGGRLYDNWALATGASAPGGDHPLWGSQTTNTRSGPATFRCKECHGWDYKGDGGAYRSGSHYTGFAGVFRAGRVLGYNDFVDALNGAFNVNHDFGQYLSDADVQAIAWFLEIGLVDYSKFVDYQTKQPLGTPDLANGETRYMRTCSTCHGDDGREINVGTVSSPEYLGTIATDNPWEFLHKALYGQPGPEAEEMPPVSTRGWTDQDLTDLLAFVQTLSTE